MREHLSMIGRFLHQQMAAGCTAAAIGICLAAPQGQAQTPQVQVGETLAEDALVEETLAEDAVPIGAASDIDVRSQLFDLDQLPLFLPSSKGRLVTSSNQASPTQLSQPSLFRIQDQLGARYNDGDLVAQWQVYETFSGIRYVDVVVNESGWSQLAYFRQYAFAIQLGNRLRTEGYHLRIFHTGDADSRNEIIDSAREGISTAARRARRRTSFLRGAHTCDFQVAPPASGEPLCEIFIR
ncbi:MAG: hypothetical protein AAFP09_07910 [Cyanobacteria bacterium J06607_10]